VHALYQTSAVVLVPAQARVGKEASPKKNFEFFF